MELALKIRQYIIYPLLFLTMLFTPDAISTETAKLIDTDTFIMEEALIMGQGITTDGEYYYTSGTITAVNITAIAKHTVGDEVKTVARNLDPLPSVCKNRGSNHIGGISYYNGKIYASVEGGSEVPACIVVYDAETLKAEGVYDLPSKEFYDGVPWCAVDKETGYLYASEWDTTKTIYVYDVNNNMAFVKAINLTGLGSIRRIQGGEFYDGTLYLSQDSNKDGKIRKIFAVDTETGEVTLAAERDVGSEKIEAEGMTFTKDENGVVLHVLDYNKTIGIFLHHYDIGL